MSAAKLTALLAGILLIAIAFFYALSGAKGPAVANFTECAAAGYPIMESYPEQCRTPDGRTFVREVAEIPEVPENEIPENNGGGSGIIANGCAVAGCSGQLCVSADKASDIMTTCEYRPEYACYKEASCEPQANGQCGWTQTPALQACLKNPSSLAQ